MDEVQLPKLETPKTKLNVSKNLAPKRKALIVAIKSSSVPELLELQNPHRDAQRIKELLTSKPYYIFFVCTSAQPLLGVYHYTDVTMLLDEIDPSKGATQPTSTNLIQHMRQLAQDVQSGDHLFFYFSGHAGQRKNHCGSEEDGKDEFIYTKSGSCISDNILRKHLIGNLPGGCHLTVKLLSQLCVDSKAHSSICPRLFWMPVTQALAGSHSWVVAPTHTATLPSGAHVKRRNVVDDPDMFGSRLTENLRVLNLISAVLEKPEPNLYNDFQSTEIFCTGFCKTSDSDKPSKGANVICLSSCKDNQLTWETNDGWSMTRALIELCERESHPTLKDLMLHVIQETRQHLLKIHLRIQSYAVKAHAWSQRQDYRQDPQLSSEPSPMDMANVLWDP
ncbi:caspase domain-containing protein [Desarmillaria tabescens]|uniref:Caspase domain-containing protein n=1 Tax=Armillaria tabescens TaxID=1929756 RepID=A0AA39K114_ARMTA|nr:caspase domain-containing protein [Desarmillaria tabescens]KAK0451179.1 caspase domain-containing protein [Desarmillaria tabescens]